MKPQLTAAQTALCDQINSSREPEQVPFLPVDDQTFTKCSNAIAKLVNDPEDSDQAVRRLSLPSAVLPPLV